MALTKDGAHTKRPDLALCVCSLSFRFPFAHSIPVIFFIISVRVREKARERIQHNAILPNNKCTECKNYIITS